MFEQLYKLIEKININKRSHNHKNDNTIAQTVESF
jgi:hypothetical protein